MTDAAATEPSTVAALTAQLCFDSPPEVDPIDVMQAVLRERPGVELVRHKGSDGTFMVAFPELRHTYLDGVTACLLVTVGAPKPVDPAAAQDRDLTQTWGWSGGREAAAVMLTRVTHTVPLVELYGQSCPPADRVRAFRQVLHAVVATSNPTVTWWPASQQALEPRVALERPLAGLVNVRMFNDAERPGYAVMDTLGMASLGLVDVQCYFRDLELDRVAGLLYQVANSLVDGVQIGDGHTVQASALGRKRLRVYLVGAMVGPDRPVLAMRP